MKVRQILIFLFLCVQVVTGQNLPNGYYWVQFSDKTGTPFLIDHPEQFLSQRAIDRRIRQHIEIDESDLPVSPVYLDSLRSLGFNVLHSSKWLNGATIFIPDTIPSNKLADQAFISSFQFTKPASKNKSVRIKFNETENQEDIPLSDYGNASNQLVQLNGQYLHNLGYRGKGIQVAVLDAGFYHADQIAAFDILRNTNRILDIRDFVNPQDNFYEQYYHGMSVLSCMGGNLPGQFIGTAPDASYHLFRTEDVNSEYLIEEDNWVAGAELADSLGADIINSSLGYSEFDDSLMNHTYADLDGKTTRVTRGANMAFQKGILVFSSAGNEGGNSWRRIVSPSDGENVIGVAAVDNLGDRAFFSSQGPAYGGVIKPNVAAQGLSTYLVTSKEVFGYASGTSFSSPVLAGMAACLMQANPWTNVKQIKTAIEQSASQYISPDSLLGYGIPDFEKADKYLKINNVKLLKTESSFAVSPNPFYSELYIRNQNPSSGLGRGC
jgi:subtilisin family serine protease